MLHTGTGNGELNLTDLITPMPNCSRLGNKRGGVLKVRKIVALKVRMHPRHDLIATLKDTGIDDRGMQEQGIDKAVDGEKIVIP